MTVKRRSGILILCGYVLMVLGIFLFVRPLIARTCEKMASLSFLYEAALPSNTPADIREQVSAYNDSIRKEQAAHGFVYEDCYDDPVYDALLAGPSGMLCVVEIPSVSILLPVGHGTGTELLRHAAGHMHGSSLPVGGRSTHAVIAAHAGMPDTELFTKLPKVRAGDIFFIYVLGEKHAYRIRKVTKVLPSESEALRIREGEDLITLMTCIPYGINTHRLLVTGERCGSGDAKAAEDLTDARREAYVNCKLWLAAYTFLPTVFPGLLLGGIARRSR